MTGGRKIALLLVVASAATMLVSVIAMARRISTYYARTDHTLFVFRPVEDRRFTFAGRPVELVDEGEGETTTVVARFGERELRVPATMAPQSPQVPGLARHEEWMRVLRFAERGRLSSEELLRRIEAGEVQDRLVIVVRDPRKWADGRPYGQGQARDWLFDLHELLPDGAIRSERFAYPRGRREAGERVGGAPPLVEGSWQYYAALMVIPKGSKPTPRFTADAVRAMGWTLPAAAFAGLVLTLSVPALLAPRHRHTWPTPGK